MKFTLEGMFLAALSQRDKTPESVFVNVYGAQESIQPTYVAWRTGTTNRVACNTGTPGWESDPGLLKRSTSTGSDDSAGHGPNVYKDTKP
jgi:hypothetical protein